MKRQNNNWNAFLHPYVDGELDEQERAAFEAELEDNVELQGQVAAIRELASLMRVEIETVADATNLDGLWAQIETSLPAESADAVAMEATPGPAIGPLQLQAFADGQLSGHDLSEVAIQVGRSSQMGNEIAAIGEMGDLVRAVVDSELDAVDFSNLWPRIDAAIGEEFKAERPAQTAPAEPRVTLFERILAFVGGSRAILASAATAAVVVLVMLPMLRGGDETVEDSQPLEIRVVHINEVRSEPGYAVSVDAFNDGNAPVIYFREEANDPGEQDEDEDPDAMFDNPI